jgi:hypothetical protein
MQHVEETDEVMKQLMDIKSSLSDMTTLLESFSQRLKNLEEKDHSIRGSSELSHSEELHDSGSVSVPGSPLIKLKTPDLLRPELEITMPSLGDITRFKEEKGETEEAVTPGGYCEVGLVDAESEQKVESVKQSPCKP